MASKRRRAQSGFAYVEILLGVLLLSVCLAPALGAIGSTLSRHSSLQNSERDLGCVLRTKERVFALSFNSLLSAAQSKHSAGKFSVPTGYSEGPTTACPFQRNVYILRYNPTLADPFTATNNDMVYVRVEQADGAAFATLAIQR